MSKHYLPHSLDVAGNKHEVNGNVNFINEAARTELKVVQCITNPKIQRHIKFPVSGREGLGGGYIDFPTFHAESKSASSHNSGSRWGAMDTMAPLCPR